MVLCLVPGLYVTEVYGSLLSAWSVRLTNPHHFLLPI